MKTELRQKRIKLIQKIQKIRKSKVFCYLTSDRQNASGIFAKDVLPIFSKYLEDKEKYQKIDVFIFTLGGDTLAAFGLNRLFREYTNDLNALIPDKCHSAGTLFALGCNQISMTKPSSLSPIDPSTHNPLNPAVNVNGQIQTLPLNVEDLAGFKNLVKDEWGIKNYHDLSVILKFLSEKVHPLALGHVYRVRQQIELLATALLKQHRKDLRKIKKIVKILSKDLGSHDYLIYRKEAKNLLGNQVATNNAEEERTIRELYDNFAQDMELGKPFMLDEEVFSKNELYFKIIMVESEDKEAEFTQKRGFQKLNDGRIHSHIKKQGWKIS